MPCVFTLLQSSIFTFVIQYVFIFRFSQYTILSNLKPFTQYAYYVRTYTVSTQRSGAQSKLLYFTTLPGQPSSVRALTIYSSGSDALDISWLPPLEPNSELAYYKVIGKIEYYDPVVLRQRNYCDERE